MLSLRAVSKRVGGRAVLRDVSLDHDGRDVVWLRGANGCGKSTLLRCVAGVWRPDRGDILVQGRSVVREPRARAQVGYVPDTFAPVPDISVYDTLDLVAALRRAPRPTAAQLERLGVIPFAHQSVTRLSAGQTRRVALLAGLIGDPWLLVLDEPTTGLDVDGVATLRELVIERRARGLATLLVTHEPAFARSVDARPYDMADGSLAAA